MCPPGNAFRGPSQRPPNPLHRQKQPVQRQRRIPRPCSLRFLAPPSQLAAPRASCRTMPPEQQRRLRTWPLFLVDEPARIGSLPAAFLFVLVASDRNMPTPSLRCSSSSLPLQCCPLPRPPRAPFPFGHSCKTQ